MKMLKKLALVSAVSMISAGAFAMEAMDDESMAAATGQDGISILVSPNSLSVASLQAMGVTNETINKIGQYSDSTGAAGAAGTFTAAVQGIDTNGDGDFVDPGETAPVASSFNAAGLTDKSKGLYLNQVVIHDDDGISTNKDSGTLVIGDGSAGDRTVVFAKGDAPISIDLDMVGDTSATAGNQSMLNVKITTPTLGIKMGAVYVSNSNAHAAGIDKTGAVAAVGEGDGSDQDAGVPIKIANAMEVVLGATTINIQLGSEAQTISGGVESAANPSAMILVDATLKGGLTINNSSLIDAGGLITGGSISMKSLSIKDSGGTGDLTAKIGINVEDNLLQINPMLDVADVPAGAAAIKNASYAEGGLVVTLASLGGAAGVDVAITNTVLGSATAKDLGDVQILGLQLGGTNLIIRGH